MSDYVLGDRGAVEIITDDFYDAELLQVFEELQIDRERSWSGQVRLVPEPDNPYQPEAIAVYWGDLKLGRMGPADSAAYWQPVCRVVASGHDPVAQLTVQACLRGVRGQTYIESSGVLSLSSPGTLFPLNNAPTQSALLPQGPSIKVLDEKDHSEYLHSILPASGEGRVILSLENNQLRLADGRIVDSVDVLHDRKVVGRLSTQISEQLAPVIRYAFDRQRLTSAWGTIRGNAFELSLTVQAVRPGEISQDWFDLLPNNVPELLPDGLDFEVPLAYRPTEGEAQRELQPKKKRSLMSYRSAEAEAGLAEGDVSADQGLSDQPLALRRVAVLLGLFGGLLLATGLVLVFFRPLLGVVAIVVGASLAFVSLFFGREKGYDPGELAADSLAS